MKIKDILNLIKDTKIYIEIIEKNSGASFGIYTNKSVFQRELIEKNVKEINVQYIDGKRILIIKF